MKTDASIQKDVLDQLRWEPFLNAAEIGVAVKNGIVTLTGIVDTYGKKLAAENAAKKIAGVRAVAEEIQVGISPSFRKTDTEIAAAVATALAWHTAIQEDKIKIRVEKGIVTLEGMVDWNFQRTAASDAIRYLAGVKMVNNLIYVKPYVTAADIQQKIKASLQRHAMIDSGKISIEVTGSKVILYGTVRSFAEMDDAVSAAWAAPGVSNVENKMIVGEPELVF